jgi:hypothetical protein
MGNLSEVVQQLRKERDRVARQLSGLNAALSAFVGVYGGKAKPTRHPLSAAARRKISLSQKARWAKQKSSVRPAKPNRTISAASRMRMAAAQRARWAKVKGQKKAA